jgi:hypothetical protein
VDNDVTRDPMRSELDVIKGAIAQEYLDRGRVNRDVWFSRYPQWRAELEGVFALTDSVNAVEGESVAPRWEDKDGTLKSIIAHTRQLLRVRGADAAEADLGHRVAAAERPGLDPAAEFGSPAARDVLGMILSRLQRLRAEPGRIDAQKTTFLLERALALGLYTGHVPHKWGLFDKALYEVEDQVSERGWFTWDATRNRFVAGESASDIAERAGESHLADPALAKDLLDHFGEQAGELALWGMVAYAADVLLSKRDRVTVAGLQNVFRETPVWKGKSFEDDHVAAALAHLVRLGLVPAEEVDFPLDDGDWLEP